ncbi:hypothetical protein [Teichococcus oryzae]|uniref:Uncharacterized protein n=1 Tax=Teichococcus oryzae TaxID=1608942 RepID=A0A5B2TD09_9PROT|nr:hypothetical protein [Pseudoroseomonas oryzae]KAA2211670.1 hypothetical protein F0Q34_18995 [Pseudoroseomonas oryzae]
MPDRPSDAEQRLLHQRHMLQLIEAADEAMRQVRLAAKELRSSEAREVAEWAGKGRECAREAQKVMIVAVYDSERST